MDQAEVIANLDPETLSYLAGKLNMSDADATTTLSQTLDGSSDLCEAATGALAEAGSLGPQALADKLYDAVWPTWPAELDGGQKAEVAPEPIDVNGDLIPALDEFVSSTDGFVAVLESVREELAAQLQADYPQGMTDEDFELVAADLHEACVEALAAGLSDPATWNAAVDAVAAS